MPNAHRPGGPKGIKASKSSKAGTFKGGKKMTMKKSTTKKMTKKKRKR